MPTQRGQPVFPYHYGFEAENYTFYRVPKVLFSEPEFRTLSTDARMLYGLMLDRMQLSIKSGWADADGRIYIIFTIDSIKEALGCGNKKAGQLLAELDDRKGIGLISRVRQGQGKPDLIYVHKCITQDMSKRHLKTCQDDTSRDAETTSPDMSEGHTNKNEFKEIENKETDLIESYPGGMDEKEYLNYFEGSLSLDILRQDFPYQKEQLDEIAALLAEICSSRKEWIRLAGEDRPADEVRSRFMSLNSEHIRYVLECLQGTTSRVRNIRQYLLTTLYNAPLTISSYYDALVRHDLYGKGDR